MPIIIFTHGEAFSNRQVVRTSSGYQPVPGAIVMAGYGQTIVQNISMNVGISAFKTSSLRLLIGGEPILHVQTDRLSIDEITPVRKVQSVIPVIEADLKAKMQTTSYDLLFDGVSIKKYVRSIQLSCEQGNVHNSISLDCEGEDLFQQSDPFDKTLQKTARITLSVGSRTIQFLLENRSGNEYGFTLWGRGLSALEDAPFATSIKRYSLPDATLASELAASLMESRSISWEATDWVVPTAFNYAGVPLDGVKKLADAIRAVVRADDDGNLVVRPAYPIRPIYMQGSTPDVSYDRSVVLRSLSYKEELGAGWNAIRVTPFTSSSETPLMEVEESPVYKGSEFHVKVYWAGRKPVGTVEEYVTDGAVTLIEEDVLETVTNKELEFNEGKASLSKPLNEMKEIYWIGDEGDDLSYYENETEMLISNQEYRVATFVYTAKYNRYRVYAHDVTKLIMVLSYAFRPDDGLLVQIDPGDKESDETIKNELLTVKSAQLAAGIAYLDEKYYDRKTFSIEAPYQDDAIDGAIIALEDGEIGCHGNFLLKSANVNFEGPRIVNTMECEQCQV